MRNLVKSLNESTYQMRTATLATTSGTTKDFPIPSWAKKITVSLIGVSTNSTSSIRIQLGDSGGIEATDYISSTVKHDGADTLTATTSGFDLTGTIDAGHTHTGVATIYLVDAASFTWSMQGIVTGTTGPTMFSSTGSKALSAELTTVRLTTASADTFDAGTVGVLYE